MMLHALRSATRNRRLLGTFVSIPSASLVEALGPTGLDLIGFDAEHACFGMAELESVLRAADIAGLPALVRVPEIGPYIGQALDLGAAGIIAPRVETAEQAEDVVSRVRYPPEGRRGAGPGRATGYGHNIFEYVQKANGHLLAVVQIETAAGVANAEEIAAVPGIDVILVGPFDLSVSLGTPIGSPDHDAAIAKIHAAARRHAVVSGMFCGSPQQVAQAWQDGWPFTVMGQDLFFLKQAIIDSVAVANGGGRTARVRASAW